ncbi:MAG: GspH/FimT family pseudopilin, partial [Candidatus Eremiobacterota bacterium]
MGRRGFSLFELMLVVALLAVATLSLLVSTRHASSRASARGLALILAEQVRLARQQAVTRQVPVALCFPSNGGAQGHTAAYYVLEGETNPRLTDTRDLRGEFPRAAAFVGVWSIASATLGKRLPIPGSAPAIDLNAWLPPECKRDYCFVFMPDGSLVTNDLPSYDGAYHVLVVAGLAFSAAG